MLLWRDLEEDEGGFRLCEWAEEVDLRVVGVGRPEAPAMGVGRLRKNEIRNHGCLAIGFRGDRPALTRARSLSLRSASSLFLLLRTTTAGFISLMPWRRMASLSSMVPRILVNHPWTVDGNGVLRGLPSEWY